MMRIVKLRRKAWKEIILAQFHFFQEVTGSEFLRFRSTIEPAIVYQLKKQGITEPFEVQEAAIPDTMLGKDVCCRATYWIW